MSTPAEIRPARASDAAALTPLYDAFLTGQFALAPWLRRRAGFALGVWVATRLAAPSVVTLVAVRDGRLVGFCDGSTHDARQRPSLDLRGPRRALRSVIASLRWRADGGGYAESRAEGYLRNVYVADGERRTGTGAALIEAMVEALAARGAEVVSLHVLEANAGAQAAFQRAGFVPTARVLERATSGPSDEPGR